MSAISYKRQGGIRFFRFFRLTVTVSVRNPANHIPEAMRKQYLQLAIAN